MPISTNFEDLIMRDTRANQPAAGVPGRFYYVTDEGVTERDNGSTWEDCSDSGGYTNEQAQDAVGAMIADTTTVNLTYTDATPELKADVIAQMSITSDASGLKLSGDSATPGNDKVYGTDGSGVKGWKADPSGGSSTSLVSDKKTITAGDYTGLTSTTFADLDATNLSITLTTGARKCLITVTAAAIYTTGSGNIQLDIDIDGARQGQTYGLVFQTTNTSNNVNLSFSFITAALSAGSHTFKVKYRTDSGTIKIYAGTSITPFVFAVQELPLKDPA